MECALEFQELANHNPFLQELLDDCFSVDFVGGHLIIYGLPYLDGSGNLAYGTMASPIDLAGHVIDVPNSHQVWFCGEPPHDGTGKTLSLSPRAHQLAITDSFATDLSFSLKLHDNSGRKRAYNSFEEKIRTYIDLITAPALHKYPEATPLQDIEKKAAEQGSPLRIPDMLSSRYLMNDVSSLLRGIKVAIIGLGGTGSYVLDMIARTHLAKIALYDDDKVHVHTMFRMPGFIPNAVMGNKVDVLAQQYGQWHEEIDPINERITAENIDQLSEFNFVFISVDDGPSRKFIIEWLVENGIPYVDCGMGLNRSPNGLHGAVRITGVNRDAFERTQGTAFLPISEKQEEDEYRKQAQVVEFNAMNACMAVIRFKQHFKLYEREVESAWHIFDSALFDLDKEDSAQ